MRPKLKVTQFPFVVRCIQLSLLSRRGCLGLWPSLLADIAFSFAVTFDNQLWQRIAFLEFVRPVNGDGFRIGIILHPSFRILMGSQSQADNVSLDGSLFIAAITQKVKCNPWGPP